MTNFLLAIQYQFADDVLKNEEIEHVLTEIQHETLRLSKQCPTLVYKKVRIHQKGDAFMVFADGEFTEQEGWKWAYSTLHECDEGEAEEMINAYEQSKRPPVNDRTKTNRVIVVSDAVEFSRPILVNILKSGGFDVMATYERLIHGFDEIVGKEPNVVTVRLDDDNMEEELNLLSKLKQALPDVQLVVEGSLFSREMVINMVRHGADRVVLAPYDEVEVIKAMTK